VAAIDSAALQARLNKCDVEEESTVLDQRKGLLRAGVGLLSLIATAAPAHHSYTRFDMGTTLKLEGTIKEYQWTNPHVWIEFAAIDPATGKEMDWSLESDSPNMLTKRGWTRKSMKPGDKAVAVVHPLKIKSDKNEAALESMVVNGVTIGGEK
jgi:hypothetical protein